MGSSPALLGVLRGGGVRRRANEAQLQAQLQANSKQSNSNPPRARPSLLLRRLWAIRRRAGPTRGGPLNPSPQPVRASPFPSPRVGLFSSGRFIARVVRLTGTWSQA